ncbi:hypothetical protein CCZ01_00385 [Helicobacter monodelphidis]|uniref:hypothetical protein n=1 Tax=Helicobacter sp. 15-1451 TaxID=2004995 RepID=UPI000DCD35F8|nr:hypothetical protein [Helicobacter sp. 15-1451]RAX59237.1 hypothetical protein CCZ01_00385 [Helicobacter sp. 15-1451]
MRNILFIFLCLWGTAFAKEVEKSWVVQKWLTNCNNRVESGLNFAFGPYIFERERVTKEEIIKNCKNTLSDILDYYQAKSEIGYSLRFFLDGVEVRQEVRDKIHEEIQARIGKFFANEKGTKVAKDMTEKGAIDIGFFVYLSKFNVAPDVDIYYGRIEGNFYFNNLYNIEYPVGIAYDSRVNLAEGIGKDIEIIIQDYSTAFKQVLAKDFFRKY